MVRINHLQSNCKPERVDTLVAHLSTMATTDPCWWLDDHWGYIVRSGKTRCKKNGRTYTIDEKYLTDLTRAQGYRCAISGIEFRPGNRHRGIRRDPFSASVDRIDNSRGYEPGNVRIVCLIVNLARADFGDAALISMAHAVAAKHALSARAA